MAILPLRTQIRGPAPNVDIDNDIVDESLYYYKSNIFFRTYEVKVGFRYFWFQNDATTIIENQNKLPVTWY